MHIFDPSPERSQAFAQRADVCGACARAAHDEGGAVKTTRSAEDSSLGCGKLLRWELAALRAGGFSSPAHVPGAKQETLRVCWLNWKRLNATKASKKEPHEAHEDYSNVRPSGRARLLTKGPPSGWWTITNATIRRTS